MAAFTRTAIRQTFLQLLDTTPLDKITVRMIVDHCGISRNTFYYHYEDIPALMRDVVQMELTALQAQADGEGSLEEKTSRFLQAVAAHRAFFGHLYRSEYRMKLYVRLQTSARDMALAAIDRAGGRELPEETRNTIAVFFGSGFLGVCGQWMKDGAREPPEALAQRLQLFIRLLHQAVDLALEAGLRK